MKLAKCKGIAFGKDPNKDIFFPGRGETPQEAIAAFCFECPVRKECDDYADRKGAKVGVWGGKRRTRENGSAE